MASTMFFPWEALAVVARVKYIGQFAFFDGNGPEFDPWFTPVPPTEGDAVRKCTVRTVNSVFQRGVPFTVGEGLPVDWQALKGAQALTDRVNVLEAKVEELQQGTPLVAALRENSSAQRRLAKAMKRATP